MSAGESEPAVRVVPTADPHSTARSPRRHSTFPRWLLPAVIGGLVLIAFAIATEPIPTTGAPIATTVPPAIAAADNGTHDLRTATDPATIVDWFEAKVNTPGSFRDVVRTPNSFVAVGQTEQRPQVWVSQTGSSWQPAEVVDGPNEESASIDSAVVWDGGVIAVGRVGDQTGLWQAASVRRWSYEGLIESMGTNRIAHLVAGPQLLAMTSGRNGDVQAWLSDDGIKWDIAGPITGLDGTAIGDVAATADGYFTIGWDNPSEGVTVLRSVDGINWSRQLLTTAGGIATDITAAEGAVYVAGRIGGDTSAVGVWRSLDGVLWDSIGGESPALESPKTILEAVSAHLGVEPTAVITVDGTTLRVAIGSEVLTEAGALKVTGITENMVAATFDGLPVVVNVGDSATFDGGAIPRKIAVEGSRVLVAGHTFGTGSPDPTMWSSPDGGESWQRALIPDRLNTHREIFIAGTNVVVFNVSRLSAETMSMWRSTWGPAK